MTENTHGQFKSIVLRGTLSTYGMSGFSDVLDEKKADAIHEFLIGEQQKLFADTTSVVVRN
jgi:hypothetical protein